MTREGASWKRQNTVIWRGRPKNAQKPSYDIWTFPYFAFMNAHTAAKLYILNYVWRPHYFAPTAADCYKSFYSFLLWKHNRNEVQSTVSTHPSATLIAIFMNTYYRTKLSGKPFIQFSSAETSLWNSQKSIKKYTKTV